MCPIWVGRLADPTTRLGCKESLDQHRTIKVNCSLAKIDVTLGSGVVLIRRRTIPDIVAAQFCIRSCSGYGLQLVTELPFCCAFINLLRGAYSHI
jgi:hypothetical protein